MPHNLRIAVTCAQAEELERAPLTQQQGDRHRTLSLETEQPQWHLHLRLWLPVSGCQLIPQDTAAVGKCTLFQEEKNSYRAEW
jgi:DNA mismatch repair protein MutH